MRGIAAFVLVLIVAPALASCSRDVPAKSGLPPVAKRAIAAGDSVMLENGLRFTVPVGWEATLAVDPSPAPPLDDREYLLMENRDSTGGFQTVMVFSSSAATIPVSALDEFGRDSFTSVGEVDGADLYIGRPDTQYSPKRLMAAKTYVPEAARGVLFFAARSDDPRASLRAIWRLFDVRGIRPDSRRIARSEIVSEEADPAEVVQVFLDAASRGDGDTMNALLGKGQSIVFANTTPVERTVTDIAVRTGASLPQSARSADVSADVMIHDGDYFALEPGPATLRFVLLRDDDGSWYVSTFSGEGR